MRAPIWALYTPFTMHNGIFVFPDGRAYLQVTTDWDQKRQTKKYFWVELGDIEIAPKWLSWQYVAENMFATTRAAQLQTQDKYVRIREQLADAMMTRWTVLELVRREEDKRRKKKEDEDDRHDKTEKSYPSSSYNPPSQYFRTGGR